MGRGGEKSILNKHIYGTKVGQVKDIPRGCLAIKVGQVGEEQSRFVVPVVYFNHPLFLSLLKEAEEEYGFDQEGTIAIPCHVEYFRYVQGLIQKDHHHHRHHLGCFMV